MLPVAGTALWDCLISARAHNNSFLASELRLFGNKHYIISLNVTKSKQEAGAQMHNRHTFGVHQNITQSYT